MALGESSAAKLALALIYVCSPVLAANPSGFLVVLGVFTSMSLNLAGGVFVAMMFWGARRPGTQQLLRDAAAKNAPFTSVGADADVPSSPLLSWGGEDLPRKGSSSGRSTGGDALPLGVSDVVNTGTAAGIAVPLPEVIGHATAVFVCVTFILAVIYDVEDSSVAPVGQEWAIAFTGIAFVLTAYHVLLPSVAAVVGMSQCPQEVALGDDDITDETALVGASDPVNGRAAAHSGASMRFCGSAAVVYGVQCEVVAVGAWLVYGAHPSSGALSLAVILCAWQIALVLMLVARLEPGSRGAFRVSFAGTALDTVAFGVWGSVLLSLGRGGGVIAGGLALGVAGALVVALVLRWRLPH